MELKEINNYGQEIIECLKLKTSPVAVKLVPKGEKVPEGIKKVDEPMRHCQLVDRVRRTGEEFYAMGEDELCKGGAGAMGLGEMPPKVASGEFYYSSLKVFSTPEAAKRTIDMVAKLPPNSTEAILYAPLEKTTFVPDVILVICNPKQIMLLTQAYMYKEGGRVETGFAGKQSLCSDGVVQTYKDHRMAMAFSLIGLRVPGVAITDPGCVSKTFPDFFSVLAGLG